MGNGKKLKNILDERNMSIRKLASLCNIPPTTLYSIVQKDTNIRYDYALKIANVLNIPITFIVDILPCEPKTTLNSCFSDLTLEIAKLLNNEEIILINNLIKEFYILDDESRKEILKIIEIKHENHDDNERLNKLENIKRH